jgi:hypothetical protein
LIPFKILNMTESIKNVVLTGPHGGAADCFTIVCPVHEHTLKTGS